MPKKQPVQPQVDAPKLEDQAMLIASEIFNLINQYTHDSNTSKFFLTDEIARVSYGLAGGFASVLYTPDLEPEETQDSAILSLLYALMTYGFNIYLREHSLTTSGSPYNLPDNPLAIKKIQKKTLEMTADGKLISTPLADKIISILSTNVKTQMELQEFKIKGHHLSKTKFTAYVKISMYWGYNFARELLTQNTKKKTQKAKEEKKAIA